MAELIKWSPLILQTLNMAGIEVDHFNGRPDADKIAILNVHQDHILDYKVTSLKARGYYLVGYFNSVPFDVRQELGNTPNVNYQILNHYCWLDFYSHPLQSDVLMVADSELAVLLKLIAADVPQFLGVHKK